jgi:hypothetical protein
VSRVGEEVVEWVPSWTSASPIRPIHDFQSACEIPNCTPSAESRLARLEGASPLVCSGPTPAPFATSSTSTSPIATHVPSRARKQAPGPCRRSTSPSCLPSLSRRPPGNPGSLRVARSLTASPPSSQSRTIRPIPPSSPLCSRERLSRGRCELEDEVEGN